VKDLILATLKIVAPVSVALIVFAQGLGIDPSGVMAYLKDRSRLMIRSLVATLILVPVAALVLLLVLKPTVGVAFGIAILVACPPAPLMLKAAPNMGGASAAFMASLHLTLAVLAFVTVPVTLYLLSIPLGFDAQVNLGAMAWILARTILIPITVGLIVRALAPSFAVRASPVLTKAGTVGLILVVLFALAAFYPALLHMDPWSYLVIVIIGAVALAIGHFLSSGDPTERTALAVECAVRHPVLALTIAGATFSPAKALPVLVPCVLTLIAVAMLYLLWSGKRRTAGKSTTNPA
jgi:BASS family bile acid:Na+ symporter